MQPNRASDHTLRPRHCYQPPGTHPPLAHRSGTDSASYPPHGAIKNDTLDKASTSALRWTATTPLLWIQTPPATRPFAALLDGLLDGSMHPNPIIAAQRTRTPYSSLHQKGVGQGLLLITAFSLIMPTISFARSTDSMMSYLQPQVRSWRRPCQSPPLNPQLFLLWTPLWQTIAQPLSHHLRSLPPNVGHPQSSGKP